MSGKLIICSIPVYSSVYRVLPPLPHEVMKTFIKVKVKGVEPQKALKVLVPALPVP